MGNARVASRGERLAGGVVLVTEECCSCHIAFAIPEDMQRRRREDHNWFYCPNGHRQHYTGEPTAQKRIQQLEKEVLRIADQREAMAAQLNATPEAVRRAADRAKAFGKGRRTAFWLGFKAATCGECCPYKTNAGGYRSAWITGFKEAGGELEEG